MSRKIQTKCSVLNCPSPSEATYFKFPPDVNLQQMWVMACRRSEPIDTNRAKICSEHFVATDFERDVRNELMNVPPRKLLNSKAVPTKGLPDEVPVLCLVVNEEFTQVVQEMDSSADLCQIVSPSNPTSAKKRKRRPPTTGVSSARKKNTCAVASCTSPHDVSYHKFPKDPELQMVWLSALRRRENIITRTALICEQHFLPSDFIKDVRNEILNLPLRKLLSPTAIPTQNLDPSSNSAQEEYTSNEWDQEWNVEEENNPVPIEVTEEESEETVEQEITEYIEYEQFDVYSCSDLDQLRNRIVQLESFVSWQQTVIDSLKHQLANKE